MAKQRFIGLAAAWAPTLMYMALIWGLSSIRLSGVHLEDVPFKDKGIHFVEFGALGFLAAHAVRTTWPNRPQSRIYWTAVLVAFGWGILDEFHQAFVPGRFGDVHDVIADGLGSLAGAAALLVIYNLRRTARARRSAS